MVVTPAHAQSPNCPAADPDDFTDDSEEIQECLDTMNAVYLERGNPGYIIGTRFGFDDLPTVEDRDFERSRAIRRASARKPAAAPPICSYRSTQP